MIDPYAGRVLARFGARQRTAARRPTIRRSAHLRQPVIKQSLCRKARPIAAGCTRSGRGGDDAHFHVRLYCPLDSLQCSAQKPIEPGDGCDAGLDAWVEEIRQAARRPPLPTPPAPEPVLPRLHGSAAGTVGKREALMRGRLKLVLLAGRRRRLRVAAGGSGADLAEHACRAVLDPPADGSDPWFRLGNALAEAGDYDAAERALPRIPAPPA